MSRPTRWASSRWRSRAATTSSPRPYGRSTSSSRRPSASASAPGSSTPTDAASPRSGGGSPRSGRAARRTRRGHRPPRSPPRARARQFRRARAAHLGLVERQLAVIEKLEEREHDPDRLETLFQLDHLATGMRRYSENLLVIAGSEHKANHPGPVPLLDVVRASISEVERYDRVQIQALPPHALVAGYAADSVSHLLAELLDNATAFSPPDAHVHVSGWLLESGEVMLSVQDEGIGMTADRLAEVNNRLADPTPTTPAAPPGGPAGARAVRGDQAGRAPRDPGATARAAAGRVAAVVVLPTNVLPSGRPGSGLPPVPPAPVAPVTPASGADWTAMQDTRRPVPNRARHAPPRPRRPGARTGARAAPAGPRSRTSPEPVRPAAAAPYGRRRPSTSA
ncbi:ATP-binding protein [Streptomyces sp. M19]